MKSEGWKFTLEVAAIAAGILLAGFLARKFGLGEAE